MVQLRRFIGACTLLVTSDLFAAQLTIGQSYSDRPINFSGTITSVTPSGNTFGFSFEPMEELKLSLDYVNWKTSQRDINELSFNSDANSLSLTTSYYLDAFIVSANYTHWRSDIELTQSTRQLQNESTSAPSYGFAVGYGYFAGDWYIEPHLAVQYNQWLTRDTSRFALNDRLEDESILISSMLSLSRIVSLTSDTYFIAGSMLRYNYVIDGHNSRRPNSLQASIGHRIPASQDKDYFELSAFITYDITKNWLIELDASFNLDNAPDKHSFSWRLGYRF